MNINHRIILTVLLVSIWSHIAVGHPDQATTEQRYSQMPFRETPYADIKGIFPLSESQAQGRKHYIISYDHLHRVVEVRFVLNNDVVPLNINKNVVTHAPHIKIEYQDDQEIRRFYDQYGNPSLSNGAFKEVYRLDELGQRISLHFLDDEGERISSGWGIYEYIWTTDDKGTVTEQRFDETGEPAEIRPGFPFYCLKLHYDQRGFLAMMENYGTECEVLTENSLNAAQDKLIYNEMGFMSSWNVFNGEQERARGNGPNVASGIMEHDEFGNTTREYYLDENGERISNAYGWFDSIAAYDAHGNMISRFNHSLDGSTSNIERLGYAGYRMTYDKQGRFRTSLAYFDEDNNPTQHRNRGYHMVKHYYEDGRLSRLEFLDENLRLTNRTDNGIASIQYIQTENGIEQVRFNKNGERLN